MASRLASYALHEIDLTRSAVLEVGCVYLVPLAEQLSLGDSSARNLTGSANPKSSIGRLDVFTRLIVDGGTSFDQVPAGYTGPLYAEIAPLAFPIVVRAGSRLNQLRLRRGRPGLGDRRLKQLDRSVGLAGADPGEAEIRRGLNLTVDLSGSESTGLVGYRAKRHTGLVDVDRVATYDPRDFWEPLRAGRSGELILDPNHFYILASKETVKIPTDTAAEMVAYDTEVGEFRVHYAGFFDPGFGVSSEGPGTRAVLEVRSHEIPFALQDGQTVGRLVYEAMSAVPDTVYGADIGSHYHAQGLTLSKHFRPFPASS